MSYTEVVKRALEHRSADCDTNYYGFFAGEDPADDEGVHLCQSAVGWEFLLQARPEDGVNDIHDWMRSLDEFDAIYDEYGVEISIDDLLEAIESRIALMKAGKLRSRFEWGHDQEFRSGGVNSAAFASYHFG